MRVAGIMSGTSLDGIDVAIVDISRKRVGTVAHSTTRYPAATRQRILAVSNTQCATGDISRLNFELGELYAKAVLATARRNGIPLESIELVGCHGQTIFHEGWNTLQIGEASVIAERVGAPVVSDFRTRDIAAGGQGAPLVPFVDYLLLRSASAHRVALNIGGIANITVLPRGARPEDVVAFDTGPGNMVIDQLVERLSGGRKTFDRDGAIAASGHVSSELLDSLLREGYFRRKPPKTAGREQYGSDFVQKLIASGLRVEDLIATATAFTAATIATGVQRFATGTEELIAAGGGVHNRQLMAQLAAFLPGVRIRTTAEFGIDPDAKEAIAFAILAERTWRREPGNLPSATGAGRPVVLGKVTFQARSRASRITH
ncbi:MAG TPA: anhydro-N-acetylmuramic acid kinase [Bryobacteraceae bacterium]|nr:anhydro-N-acetylmuramic acid kinase [Bryobacteraceae bacterium]